MSNIKKRRLIAWVLLALTACVMAFSGYKLWEIKKVYQEGSQSYAQLANWVRSPTATPGNTLAATTSAVAFPEFNIDFAALQAVNEDALAWLYSPDAAIDYPVMRASDYNWYLRHLPDGTYNANGALFLDYNNPYDFSGRLNIIYGHNMSSGKMFGSLTEYKNQSYFEEHPYLYLYTAEQGNFTAELLYGCVIGAGEWRSRAFMYEANLSSLLDFAALNTTFESDTVYTQQDRFLVLSTCSYEFDDARYIVIGVLRPQ